MSSKQKSRREREAEQAARIQARADDWMATSQKHFDYLESVYGFHISEVDASCIWNTRIVYRTDTVAIYVDCNVEYLRAEVSLVRLLDGELPEYPKRNMPRHQFLIDDLVQVRAHHLLPKLMELQGLEDEQIEESLKFLARVLREYADDVLHGDFTVFAALEEVINERIRLFDKRKEEIHSISLKFNHHFECITTRFDHFSIIYNRTTEEADLCLLLTKTLCQRNFDPLLHGKYDGWTGSIIHAVYTVNQLFGVSAIPTEEDLANYFKISVSTMRTKSRQIRKFLEMVPLAPEWQLPSLIKARQASGPES